MTWREIVLVFERLLANGRTDRRGLGCPRTVVHEIHRRGIYTGTKTRLTRAAEPAASYTLARASKRHLQTPQTAEPGIAAPRPRRQSKKGERPILRPRRRRGEILSIAEVFRVHQRDSEHAARWAHERPTRDSRWPLKAPPTTRARAAVREGFPKDSTGCSWTTAGGHRIVHVSSSDARAF